MMWTVYRLVDPTTNQTRYIGPVDPSVVRRRAESISKAKKGRSYTDVFGPERALEVRRNHSAAMVQHHARRRQQAEVNRR